MAKNVLTVTLAFALLWAGFGCTSAPEPEPDTPAMSQEEMESRGISGEGTAPGMGGATAPPSSAGDTSGSGDL